MESCRQVIQWASIYQKDKLESFSRWQSGKAIVSRCTWCIWHARQVIQAEHSTELTCTAALCGQTIYIRIHELYVQARGEACPNDCLAQQGTFWRAVWGNMHEAIRRRDCYSVIVVGNYKEFIRKQRDFPLVCIISSARYTYFGE